jgi:site-specific DNA-methyltransferase (adenine-specific)
MSIVFLHGDCLEKMKDLSGASIDCFICDLPYGCLSVKRGGKRIGECEPGKPNSNIVIKNKPCAWDIPINLEAFWEQVRRLRKNDHTPCLMFCTTKFGYDLIKSNEREFRYDLVWDKQRGVSFLSANKMPMRSHEMIYVFSKTGAFYNRVDISGNFPAFNGNQITKNKNTIVYSSGMPNGWKKNSNDGTTRCALSVIDISRQTTQGKHPTEKPMELYKFLLERFCPPGGTILDPTAGSFNSCFAAMELDRHAIGIEKDLDFFNKACKRADNL